VTIAGNLRTMGISDMLQWLSTSHKTGTLVIDGTTYTKKLYLRRGTVIAVASDNPREMLGYYLVGWGYLDEGDLQYLIDMQDHFQIMLGELVVKLGYMSTREFDQVLRVKTEETLYDLLLWEEGNFRFLDAELPDRAFLEVQLAVPKSLLEGFRQRDERKRMRHLVPSTQCRPRVTGRVEAGGDAGRRIVATIDGSRSIEEVALACRLPEFEVLRFVHRAVESESIALDPPSDVIRLVPGQSDAPWMEGVRDVDDRLRRGRFLDALHLLKSLDAKHKEQAEARAVVAAKTRQLERLLDDEQFGGTAILEPAIAVDELMNLECDPAEGFVLSRINGRYSMEEVLSQLPGSRLTNRVLVHNLFRRGLIKMRDITAVKRWRSVPPLEPGDPFQP
jgi:hypothetical protein